MSMTSYQRFAWHDARAMAQLFDDLYDPVDIFRRVRRFDWPTWRKLELRFKDDVSEMLKRSDGQRPAFLRRLAKANPKTIVPQLVLMFAIIAQERAYAILDAQGLYRRAVMPGGGNRVTCQDVYGWSHVVRELFDSYGFPIRAFDAQGIHRQWDESPDDEDDLDDEGGPFG